MTTLAVALASSACGLALLAAASSTAVPLGREAGACFAGAEIQRDILTTTSAVACDQPHTVQTIGEALLPPNFAAFTLTQLRDQGNTSLRTALAEFGDQTCAGKVTARAIWPKQGAAIGNALVGLPASTGGGVLPGYGKGMNFGWVFPDAAAFDAGDRSLVCVVYVAEPKDASVAEPNGMLGSLLDLGSSATLPQMRDCSLYNPKTKRNVDVSCARPHSDELLVHYVAQLPVDVSKMTDAQWTPFDAQCQALVDVLVGAKRKELRVVADPSPDAKAKAMIYMPCFVSLQKNADGSRRKLPGGTVVGLGTRSLKSA